jgi:hypothetical protein
MASIGKISVSNTATRNQGKVMKVFVTRCGSGSKSYVRLEFNCNGRQVREVMGYHDHWWDREMAIEAKNLIQRYGFSRRNIRFEHCN